jgi:D-glucosaminate-6-phosphate ammonia-lyase
MSDIANSAADGSHLSEKTERLYAELGVRPVINAAGAYTVLGGSMLSPAVRVAMDAAGYSFADMQALLDASGLEIASLLDADSAYVTAGAAASLALAAAACLTQRHREHLGRLPDTTGIANEIIVQKNSRQKYDRCLTIAGARIVEAGDDDGLNLEALQGAIGANTVAVHYLAPGAAKGTPAVEDLLAVAHQRDLPVVVDAAGQTYPLDKMRKYARLGADLVCYAGKYFDAPQSTGLIVGRRELVELAAANGFIGFETSGSLTLGRGMKVDRQEIFGCVVALREWLSMDHEQRLGRYGERIDTILAELRGLEGIEAFRVSEREIPTPQLRDGVRVVFGTLRKSAKAVAHDLREGEPSIWTHVNGDSLDVSVGFMHDEDAEIVGRRLGQVLVS